MTRITVLLMSLQKFSGIVQMLNAPSEVLFLDRGWLHGFLEFSTVSSITEVKQFGFVLYYLNLMSISALN